MRMLRIVRKTYKIEAKLFNKHGIFSMQSRRQGSAKPRHTLMTIASAQFYPLAVEKKSLFRLEKRLAKPKTLLDAIQ